MRQSVTFPMRTQSENEYRRGNPRVHAMQTRKQRDDVTLILRAELTKATAPCTVELVRVSAGELDDDNLCGALKHVRDAVARWIGTDDGRKGGITFEYDQKPGPRGQPAVRITIEDEQPGGDYAKDLVARSSLAARAKPKAKPTRSPRGQGATRGQDRAPRAASRAKAPDAARSFAKLNGQLIEITELSGNADPPREIRVHSSDGWETSLVRDDAWPGIRRESELKFIYRIHGDQNQ